MRKNMSMLQSEKSSFIDWWGVDDIAPKEIFENKKSITLRCEIALWTLFFVIKYHRCCVRIIWFWFSLPIQGKRTLILILENLSQFRMIFFRILRNFCFEKWQKNWMTISLFFFKWFLQRTRCLLALWSHFVRQLH